MRNLYTFFVTDLQLGSDENWGFLILSLVESWMYTMMGLLIAF